ncbi:type VII secretion target [Actinokineospora enzanensis]|uniref:type VII secretion target n=1 Tax=Actinokineospora enzanensis TaxID=155975 RepID=UPI000374EA56|nr:type VII secretion target [Actinokineospora enzanensis]
MAEDDGFDVITEALAKHARSLDGVRERLGTALSAAREVSMDNDAYGVLGRPFAWLLDPFESLGTDMISQAEDTVTTHAEGMRSVQRSYDGTEDANADAFRGGPV